MRRMMFVERCVKAWQARAASEDWGAWAMGHKADNDMLNWITEQGAKHG